MNHSDTNTPRKARLGFAAIALRDPERMREIARKGGQTAQATGRGHRFTPEEVRAGGKKGGDTISQNLEHMSRIGKKGGRAATQKYGGWAHVNRTPEEQPLE
jgi:uncharacterized protein